MMQHIMLFQLKTACFKYKCRELFQSNLIPKKMKKNKLLIKYLVYLKKIAKIQKIKSDKILQKKK
jgi:hypothetical protein